MSPRRLLSSLVMTFLENENEIYFHSIVKREIEKGAGGGGGGGGASRQGHGAGARLGER